MGNCVFKGISSNVLDEEKKVVKVVTSNGGMMELCTPITVECITNEFPGHGIYRSRRDLLSEPLHHNEELHAGEVYYLLPLPLPLPLNPFSSFSSSNKTITRQLSLTPYRMSEVCPRYNKRGKGVWKVKLVISREQLSEILSEESRTEELIESLRTVAKCGNGVPSLSNSDHLSLSSSWKERPYHSQLI